MRAGRRILTGVKVLDFTWALAGPYSTRMLADMGADIIKVDPPALTERARPARAAGSLASNLGKRSIGLNLKREEGVAIATALASRADVLVENFSPGVMSRLGLSADALCEANPRLIYASISGFGQDTPRRAYGAVAHAESGWMWMQQRQAGTEAPFAPGVQIADIVTGIHAFAAIMSALYDRERTGRGQRVDVSLMDSQLALLTNAIQGVLNGTNADAEPSAHAVYETQDGRHVTINPGGELNFNFGRVARALGHPEAKDPAPRGEASTIIRKWAKEITLDQLTQGMEREGAAYGVLRSLPEAARHPHYEAPACSRRSTTSSPAPRALSALQCSSRTRPAGPLAGRPSQASSRATSSPNSGTGRARSTA